MNKPGPKPIPILVDWPLLLTYVRKHCGPLSRLAEIASMDEPTINRLARGEIMSPRFHQGIQLLDYAKKTLPSDDWERVKQVSPVARRL